MKWLVTIRTALAVGQEWCEVAGHLESPDGTESVESWYSAQFLLFSSVFSLVP